MQCISLAQLNYAFLSTDSPMDMSVVEAEEEKSVNVNDVPDYAAEIHSYLREMEVRNL